MDNLLTKIEGLSGQIDGKFAVCVLDIETQREIGILLDEPLPMASVCKLPILVAAYREFDAGKFDLEERVEFDIESQCLGSGLFNYFRPGLMPTLYDCLLMMIVVSDNAATDIVASRLTTSGITQHMRTLGHQYIRIDRLIRDLIGDILIETDPRFSGVRLSNWDSLMEDHRDLKAIDNDLALGRESVNRAASVMDTSSVREISRLCSQIALGKAASPESCEQMLKIMDRQLLNGRLPRNLPSNTRFPHKTGTLGSGAVVNDAGLLYDKDKPLAAISILSRDIKNPHYETSQVMAEIGRAVYDHYLPQN